jgi:hypothetical protein
MSQSHPEQQVSAWQSCEDIKAGITSAIATWSGNEEVSVYSVHTALMSKGGLLVFDITGMLHASVQNGRKSLPLLRCVVYNPNALTDLDAMAVQAVSAYAVPRTYGHWCHFMTEQLFKVTNSRLCIKYKHSLLLVVQHLTVYRQYFEELVARHLLGGGTYLSPQQCKHHITTWCILLLFHLNMWMKAITRRDTSLLETTFHTQWNGYYMRRFNYGEPPQMPYAVALSVCELRHSQCDLNGTTFQWCGKCGLGQDGAGSGRQPTAQEREDSPEVVEWYKKAKAWVAKNKGKEVKDFALATNTPRPHHTKKKPIAAAASAIMVSGAVGAEKFVNSQDLVVLHPVHKSS